MSEDAWKKYGGALRWVCTATAAFGMLFVGGDWPLMNGGMALGMWFQWALLGGPYAGETEHAAGYEEAAKEHERLIRYAVEADDPREYLRVFLNAIDSVETS